MLFKDVLGLEHIKNHLIAGVQNGRIPHAQLFVGQEALPVAIAYSQYILCQNTGNENTGGHAACNLMMEKLGHPDLHFVYPVVTTEKIKSHPVSSLFAQEWRNFVLKNPYGNLFEWLQTLGVENKQGIINVDEAQEIVKKLSLKAYEGGYKVMIIWMAEKMNTECANKLLKLLEEPPQKTVFILIAQDKTQLLDTIVSRCQLLEIPLLSEEVIATGLTTRENIDYQDAREFARQSEGLYSTALQLSTNQKEDVFESWAINWVRSAFRAKGNKTVINDLLQWSETVAASGREVQKNFLDYCVSFFRQALLINYQADALVYLKIQDKNFALEKFAPFVHGNNILQIITSIEEAAYHIERNGNPKIIFFDLSINLTRLLHTPGK